MKLPKNIRLHGLRAQVLLWTILPLTILLIVFSLTGINQHQTSMHILAAEENLRLVKVLAMAVSLQVDNDSLRQRMRPARMTIESLELERLLESEYSHTAVIIALLDKSGEILYASDDVPDHHHLMRWDGVQSALNRETGVLFEPDTGGGDVIAYAPVPNTDWVLMVRKPWHSFAVPLLQFEEVIPFVLLMAIIVSILTLFFGLRYVVRPLQELGVKANRIGQGDFEAAAQSVNGVQEIEDLRQTVHQMAQRIQEDQKALQDYLHKITQTQEDERARIGRELHDETVQTLIALGHKAQKVQRSLENTPERTSQHVTEIRQMVAQAIEGVRRFSQAMHPVYLEELGLIQALEILAQEAGAEFHMTGSIYRLSPERELALYRIAQEALNNARRHAYADEIQIEMEFAPSQVVLRVCDDGKGFEMPLKFNTLTHQGHFGLMGIHERVLLLKGKLRIDSSPGKGTTVTVILDRFII